MAYDLHWYECIAAVNVAFANVLYIETRAT